MEQPTGAKKSKVLERDCTILIVTLEREHPAGLIATFADGMTSTDLDEELLQLRPHREPTEFTNDTALEIHMGVLPEFKREQRVRDMTDPIQIVAVLLYLIKKTCDDRFLVLHYAELAEEPIERVMEVIRRELAAEIQPATSSLAKMSTSSPSPEHSRVLEECQESS